MSDAFTRERAYQDRKRRAYEDRRNVLPRFTLAQATTLLTFLEKQDETEAQPAGTATVLSYARHELARAIGEAASE